MKKLPKIYQGEFNKKIINNKKICYVEKSNDLNVTTSENEDNNIMELLNEIFSGIGYSYNIPVIIKTANKEYTTSIIAKTKKNIITLDNEVIPISEIVSIKKKKN